MSTNDKNHIRNGYTKNFTKYRLDRYMVIDDEIESQDIRNKTIKKINEELWYLIQTINFRVKGRILPFVVIHGLVKEEAKVRILVNDYTSKYKINQYRELTNINMADTSHFVNFRMANGQRKIEICDGLIPGDAKLLIDNNILVRAAVDIFLDVAMFNSFSFLRNNTIQERKKFNQLKKHFYEKYSTTIQPVAYDVVSPYPDYFSLAFCCRDVKGQFNYDMYVWLWEKLIKENNYKYTSNELHPTEMIDKYYIDTEQLPKQIESKDFWNKQIKGDVLLLRINKKPTTQLRQMWMCDFFGITSFRCKGIKVVSTDEVSNYMLQRELQELNISAFKLINK